MAEYMGVKNVLMSDDLLNSIWKGVQSLHAQAPSSIPRGFERCFNVSDAERTECLRGLVSAYFGASDANARPPIVR